MEKVNIIFKNKTPFSLDFDDFYFNSQDGIQESKYIYSEAFKWNDEEQFIIAETGFGIGLNFFLTLKRFLKEQVNQRLFYISIEKFYIEKEILREIYKKLGFYEDFKEILEPFLKFYPPCKEGCYRFYFKNCFLDLIFDDVSVLKRLDFKANVWFLDGFSPSKNFAMFDDNVLLEVARLSKKGTQICTFSAASLLQKNLKKYGFSVQKVKGFRKREMIKAFFEKDIVDQQMNQEAYFQRVFQKNENKEVAIIGAGICAATLAYELSLRDFKVSVFEKNTCLGEGASGNESGILSSLILKPNVALGEFSQFAFVEASRFYRQILDLKLNGVIEIAHNDLMQERFLSQENNILFNIKDNQAFLQDGGHINPKKLVQTLFEKSKAKIYFNHKFKSYQYKNGIFNLFFDEIKDIYQSEILIYAMGADTKDFVSYEFMNLSKVRGQVTHLEPFCDIEFPLSSKAYICPKNEGIQVIGASYDRLNCNPNPQREDDEENIKNIKEFLKGNENLIIKGSKVGFRSYSSDRFAIIGAAYDEEFYKACYKDLLWTKNKDQKLPKNIPNLYLNFAHGSRAFSTAVLAARYLCALIKNEPLCVYKDFISCIHPARFLIRKLKKGLK
ncbi:bifunctional tRNA (5-methylaminomethyl-2-thiouridine)(34)-methyltransferase MnmD/FAD-dependent 5-carboxymethylaminomethyl-2-thiouridine(34) oxidoreductase MnmC [Campylobacter estrildidarum]|uniref:Bifunctional tRNA (5-methylaminomethyl-2-thiouridine)(34)-methyltransferase MnmD/FAD-dependent 5-carboxymethylaminomethyl-2-thiouridine(34) oxidoreductase MnmC n=1 Tax=Campylobacter estrildidarum TaxID=2510189 RepID=A0A4U7BP67_9BACT|nr:bifunctional tRNA (5-methylaminomethyl-2-thiouridine)(34)-methyltransferase MnmD/FAD-dependent 5-carboxymethylaminomethyl-2-thiouridine(34) oxidoreductase MnmC [Campylobacter estrildidarum]TKX32020.1 bifunctional tRNA (5-methylaminomethyl-2-thiouridine)(34)-methyltransferase MnmD/FAD-dependent 5-carboxymethylaminomethyl-2-thiouridine(34) oxidoreductase MnmC [Campylobacter estrildidarum]